MRETTFCHESNEYLVLRVSDVAARDALVERRTHSAFRIRPFRKPNDIRQRG
jgi:hypothetical protein